MLPVLPIGPLAIQTPGLIILVGLWLSLSLVERFAPRFGVKASDLYNLAFISLLAGLVGARLAVVFRYPAQFSSNPLSIFSLNPGLLDPLGGAIFGILAGVIFAQRKDLPGWTTLDALTPGLGLMGVFLGFAHLASGAAFGAPADLPWSLTLWGAQRHPSQVYEILAASIILGLIWPGRSPCGALIRPAQPGVYFLSFIALSAGARLVLEAWRGDSSLLFAGLRGAQVIAWMVLAASLAGIAWLRRSNNFSSTRALPDEEQSLPTYPEQGAEMD